MTEAAMIETTSLGSVASLGWLGIGTPGTYVCRSSGQVIRVCGDGQAYALSPLPAEGKRPRAFTKISDDPYLSHRHARMLASNLDLEVCG